ncbi:MAG TPA: hypothetical protein VGD67_23770 [Pseudonocardiaceae bacterium]
MSEPGRGGLLSGLVSRPAAELFNRLQAGGSLRIGTGPGDVDVNSAAVRELLEAAVIFRSGQDDALIRPVAPATALRALLERRHEDLGDLQARIREGWKRLESELPLTVAAGGGSGARHGVEILTDGPRISATAAEIYHSARAQFRGTETGHFPTRPSGNRGFRPPAGAIEAGIRYRYLYAVSAGNTTWGQQIIRAAMDAGEEIRLRRTMPVKIMVVDHTAALLSVDAAAAHAALLIRSPGIIAMLTDWFDLMWDDRLTTTIAGDATSDLKPDQLRVLRALPAADTDEAIARDLGMSVTTVRRHIKSIYEALGVNTRFAAGAAAVRRRLI